MRIRYLGHSSFVVTSDTGTKIVTDPYKTGGNLSYGDISESADVVTASHDHFDHNNVGAVRGNPEVVRGAAKVKGIEFKGIPSYHDEAGGKQRGSNTIFCFDVDGIRVCHLGDLGHRLSDQQVTEIGQADILFVPVGGYYTIDAKVATEVCNQIKPRVIIPMHFRTDRGLQVLAGVEDFLGGKANLSQPDSSEVEFGAGQLPTTTQIVVLKPAL